MARSDHHVQTCPDCGGILQITAPEALTSAEVQSSVGEGGSEPRRQCLICGYEEALERDVAAV